MLKVNKHLNNFQMEFQKPDQWCPTFSACRPGDTRFVHRPDPDDGPDLVPGVWTGHGLDLIRLCGHGLGWAQSGCTPVAQASPGQSSCAGLRNLAVGKGWQLTYGELHRPDTMAPQAGLDLQLRVEHPYSSPIGPFFRQVLPMVDKDARI